jgi:hypothetical protein
MEGTILEISRHPFLPSLQPGFHVARGVRLTEVRLPRAGVHVKSTTAAIRNSQKESIIRKRILPGIVR